MKSIIRIGIWDWIYAGIWCLLLLAAAFPSIFLDYDFSFLNDSENMSMSGISKSYMFAVVMIIVVHLLDVVHIITSNELSYDKMKAGFLQTVVSIMLIAISLIFVSSLDSYAARLFWFLLFWGILFVYKACCVQMLNEKSIDLEEIQI
jgi:hypothetical protein